MSAEPLDLLVVGGGITGAGVARDAALRGFRTALIDKGDFGSGTSSVSSRLVHGGLRYLASGKVGVAWESASERAILATKVAPHLVRPFCQVIPVFSDTSAANQAMVVAGLKAGDALRRATRLSGHVLPAPRHIHAEETKALVPAVRTTGLDSAYVGWDGQLEDDARLVVAIARTAAAGQGTPQSRPDARFRFAAMQEQVRPINIEVLLSAKRFGAGDRRLGARCSSERTERTENARRVRGEPGSAGGAAVDDH